MMKNKPAALFSLLLAVCLGLCACAQPAPAQSAPARLLQGAAENDVLTFVDNSANKPIIRIATQYYMPDAKLTDALHAAFPDYLFVIDYATAAGVNSEDTLLRAFERDSGYDLLISGNVDHKAVAQGLFVDLSAERFLDDYLLSSLNSVSVDGHIYAIPATSTLAGIAFNADMFAEHGWEIPESHDEFFALCERIEAAGVSAFSTNFKYVSQMHRLLSMMNYAELFRSQQSAAWLADVQQGGATFKGHMEPFFELAKRMVDTGVLTLDEFSASLTQQRQDFWAGKYAMIEYDSAIFTYAQSEKAPFALGIMPYPARKAEDAGFSVTPEYYFCLPKSVQRDPERLALMKEVLAYLSSEAGQQVMLSDSLRISNVKGIALGDNPAARFAQKAYERGNLYPVVNYAKSPGIPFLGLQEAAIRTFFEGGTVQGAIALVDEGARQAFAQGAPAPPPQYETLATAEADFTMLETSYYIADKLRAAADADVGLMINRGFFCSNLAAFAKGEISSDLRPYIMKGVGAKDFLTTYRLNGAQLRELLEHPIINGAEIDALIAASGLVMEYAPWNARGSRVQKLTLADGSPLDDGRLYTVAAWKGVVDARYITETVTEHGELGALTDILESALRADGTIRPDIAGRLTLLWPAG